MKIEIRNKKVPHNPVLLDQSKVEKHDNVEEYKEKIYSALEQVYYCSYNILNVDIYLIFALDNCFRSCQNGDIDSKIPMIDPNSIEVIEVDDRGSEKSIINYELGCINDLSRFR